MVDESSSLATPCDQKIPDPEIVYRAATSDGDASKGVLKQRAYYPTPHDTDGLSVFRAGRCTVADLPRLIGREVFGAACATADKIRTIQSPVDPGMLDVCCTASEQASGDPHAAIVGMGVKVKGQMPNEQQKIAADELRVIFQTVTPSS